MSVVRDGGDLEAWMQEAADDLAADGNEQPGLVGLLWERPFNPQRWAHRSDIHEEASVKAGARRVRAFGRGGPPDEWHLNHDKPFGHIAFDLRAGFS